MAAIPDDIYQELIEEFGEHARSVAERALRSEITRHRISTAIARGVDPARAVADALARDPAFLAQTDRLMEKRNDPSSLEDRLRRWG